MLTMGMKALYSLGIAYRGGVNMTQVKTKDVELLIGDAKVAQEKYESFSQEQVDKIVQAVAHELTEAAEELAQLAHEETGFGNVADKTTKNLFASETVYDSIKDKRTVGVLNENEEGVMEIGLPMGVIAALIPMTNPTSTVTFKALIALKTRNSIVFSPHPAAVKSIVETARKVEAAAVKAGAPEGLIQVIEEPSLDATDRMMRHENTALILATGGSQMVKAAYSSGNPAIGVGAGNGPAYFEKTANIEASMDRIFESKLFDYGMICTSEESIVTEASIKEEVVQALTERGAYFLNEEEEEKLSKVILRENGTLNPAIVGRPALKVAELAQIDVPENTTLLVVEQNAVEKGNPYSGEKLSPILTLFTVDTWEEGLACVSELLENQGRGHTAMIHSEDEAKIEAFGLSIDASRIMVNAGGTFGGIGATTRLAPSLTLGCGTSGGSSTTDNINVEQLLNIRRLAKFNPR